MHTRCAKRLSSAKIHVRRSQASYCPRTGYLRRVLVPTSTWRSIGAAVAQHGPRGGTGGPAVIRGLLTGSRIS